MSQMAIEEILLDLNQIAFVDFIAALFTEFMPKW